MRAIFTGLAVAAVSLALYAVPAAAAPICLSVQDIKSTDPVDRGSAILFHMRDGKLWRNDLKGRCPELEFNGFSWVVRGANEQICENMQTLRVLHSGDVCMLGKFTQMPTPDKKG